MEGMATPRTVASRAQMKPIIRRERKDMWNESGFFKNAWIVVEDSSVVVGVALSNSNEVERDSGFARC